MTLSGPGGTWKRGRDEWGLEVIAWQVWYSDGSTHHATDPRELPAEGVQVVCAHHSYGRRTMQTACDEYVLDGVSLIGEEMPTLDDYMEIYRKALADPWRPPTT